MLLGPTTEGVPSHQLFLHAKVPAERAPHLRRGFQLAESSLVVESLVLNKTGKDMETSLGEHYYFRMEGHDISELTIGHDPSNMQDLNELLEDEQAISKIKEGQAQFWPGYDGSTTLISFPDGKTINLSADCTTDEGDQRDLMGMLIWARKDEDQLYICFEPVVGVTELPVVEDVGNTGLWIPDGARARLATAIELV